MKKSLISLIYSIVFFVASGQNNKNFFYSVTGSQFISIEKAITKIAPSVGAAIDDSLVIGTPINILMIVPYSESIDGIEVPWVKVTYKKEEFTKVTFLLASQISLHSTSQNGLNYLISWGGKSKNIAEINQQANFILQILGAKKIINSIHIICPIATIETQLHLVVTNNIGLKKTSALIKLTLTDTIKNTKNTFPFLECENNQLLALPALFNNDDSINYIKQTLFFPSSKQVKSKHFCITTEKHTANNLLQKTKSIYRFKDCAFSLLEK